MVRPVRSAVKKSKINYKTLGEIGKGISFFATPAYASTSKTVKAPKKPTAKQVKDAKNLPPYLTLIKQAIEDTHKPRKGSSVYVIVKWLEENYPGKADRSQIRGALRRGLTTGELIREKASYRIAPGSSTTTTKSKRGRKPATGTKRKPPTSRAKGRVAKKAAPTKVARSAPAKPLTKKKSSIKKTKVFTTSTVAPESGSKWQYDHMGWKDYDLAASDVVEAAYQEWLKNPFTDVRSIHSGQWQYQVDFNLMTQTNIQHEAHTSRKIRRVKK